MVVGTAMSLIAIGPGDFALLLLSQNRRSVELAGYSADSRTGANADCYLANLLCVCDFPNRRGQDSVHKTNTVQPWSAKS